jgi:hypothetical protein
VRITPTKPHRYTHIKALTPVQITPGEDHSSLIRLNEENTKEWEIEVGY